jgi:hypothetical protein
MYAISAIKFAAAIVGPVILLSTSTSAFAQATPGRPQCPPVTAANIQSAVDIMAATSGGRRRA